MSVKMQFWSTELAIDRLTNLVIAAVLAHSAKAFSQPSSSQQFIHWNAKTL
jgi:hypothetical protein